MTIAEATNRGDDWIMQSKNREIDILRGIAFCLVLIGHSFPDSAYGYINAYTEFGREYIYSFHMPLFFIISGFCMNPLLSQKAINIKLEIIKRSKRLLIPYFFYSYIAIIPKLIFNSYMYIKFEPKIVLETLLGNSASGSLWYLWNLFVINIFFLFISRFSSNKKIWLSMSLMLYIMHLLFHEFYFDKLLEYPVFYVIGVFVSTYFSDIREWLSSKGKLALLFMVINAAIVITIGNDERVRLLTALFGSISMLYLSIQIVNKGQFFKKALKLASDYSYGIYLMSPYVQVAIRVFLYKALGVPYLLCMGLMVILGFVLPYVIIKYIVRKNRYLSRILIGQW